MANFNEETDPSDFDVSGGFSFLDCGIPMPLWTIASA
jgi:hypothetical protein